MSNDAGGPPGPPNMNGQERPPQPIGGSRARPPPNNVSAQPQGVEQPPRSALEVWNEVSDGLDRNATGAFACACACLLVAARVCRQFDCHVTIFGC
jgi:hypothetical protein